MHGFAFNINTNLSYFDHIIPCGIADPNKSVCSLSSLLGKNVDLQEIKRQVITEFSKVFGLDTRTIPLGSLNQFTLQNL